MNVIYGVGQLKASEHRPVVTIGVFDGVHVGHQALIQKIVRRAEKVGGSPCVLTFDPHPVHVLHPEAYQPLIVPLSYRLTLLARYGVATCLVVRFTRRFASMAPSDFITRYLHRGLQAGEVFIGDDFRFGQSRTGTLDVFHAAAERYGFNLNVLPSVHGNHRKIGSTQIRQLIAAGELRQAERLLGRPVVLVGIVVKGDARGATLGYPTANLKLNGEVAPPGGVYAVRVQWRSQTLNGVANLGVRPSFKRKSPGVILEVHIFDFNQSIYGEEIVVEFVKKIRDEQVFLSQEDLVQQIQKDERSAKKVFKLKA